MKERSLVTIYLDGGWVITGTIIDGESKKNILIVDQDDKIYRVPKKKVVMTCINPSLDEEEPYDEADEITEELPPKVEETKERNWRRRSIPVHPSMAQYLHMPKEETALEKRLREATEGLEKDNVGLEYPEEERLNGYLPLDLFLNAPDIDDVGLAESKAKVDFGMSLASAGADGGITFSVEGKEEEASRDGSE